MPRKTHAQIAILLADYDAAQRDKRKAETREKELKAEIEALNLDERVYGDWSFAHGTPRNILDQPEAKRLLTEKGVKVPMVQTKAPIVVKLVEKKSAAKK